jgi:hypothetical protein
VRPQRVLARVVRHQPLVRATTQHLRDHLAQRAEHVVAAGLEDQVVELDVGREEVDQLARLAETAEIHRELGDARALRRGRVLGGERRRDRLDRAAQLRQRAELIRPAGAGEPPADDARVVDVPAVRALHHFGTISAIASSTRTQSRTTVRETPKRRCRSSMVRRLPSASAPSTMSRPIASIIRVGMTSAAGPTVPAGAGVGAGVGADRVVMVLSG